MAQLERELPEARAREAATSEILRAIAGSPTGLQQIFDAVAESATRLCQGMFGGIYRFDGEVMSLMRADLTKVRQALFNLLSNAAKFTERWEIELSASREKSDGAAWLQFAVRDSGIGMTPEQQERLFQAFTRAEASASGRYGRTGLGPAITRHFCQLMGGEVSVESEAGVGSTFTIRLPADAELAEIPVVTMTMLTDRKLGYVLGASDYLTKPLDLTSLLATIEARLPR